ncbi:MAG: hypothetical protein NVV57_02725 [Demequina sp.]|nr:hypothetical protein [Demequina sp.]
MIAASYDPNNPETWPFQDQIDRAISSAQANKASQAQLDALTAAKASGGVTEAQVREATEAVAQCIQDLGGTTSPMTDTTSRGLWFPNFTYAGPPGVSEDEFSRLYDDCENKNRVYLMNVYGQQPQAQEALVATLQAHEQQLKSCLKEMGGHDVDDMTINEMWEALKDQSFGGEDYGYSRDKDCIIDAGINW